MQDSSPLEKARRAADRHNRRVEEAMPLFATDTVTLQAIATPWTAERVIESRRRYEQQLERAGRAQEERAVGLRAKVAMAVDAASLAGLDAYRNRTYPSSPEYSCDFWRRILADRKGHGVI